MKPLFFFKVFFFKVFFLSTRERERERERETLSFKATTYSFNLILL